MKKDKSHSNKASGFKVPKHYFENFEDEFMQHIDEQTSTETQNLSGFTVPEEYFEAVEDTILDQLKSRKTKVVQLNTNRRLYYIAGIAASLLLMVAIFINFGTTKESISVEMVETYLADSDLDSYELAELLSEVDLLEDDFTIIQTPYEESNLEDYLIENADIELYLE